MKKFLFSACAVLAILGCGGDMDDLPPLNGGAADAYIYCRYSNTCVYMSAYDCSYVGGANYGNDRNCGYVPPPSSSSSFPSSSSSRPSSSSVVPSSSSSVLPSSSSSVVPSSSSVGYSGSYGSVTYEGQTYKTVKIGTQTWMAENLNYNASGSRCYGDNTGSDSQNRCSTYGRLYNWSTAMNGAASSTAVPSGVRGICPSGWHLPSDAEWTLLENAVGGSSVAGTKLKATSGWYNNGNGTNEYGFSALPGGGGYSGGSFKDVEGSGNWWSSTEYSSDGAYYRHALLQQRCGQELLR